MADKAVHLAIENLMRLAFAAAALIAFSGPIALAQTGSEVIARIPKKILSSFPTASATSMIADPWLIWLPTNFCPKGNHIFVRSD
jgi:hypothetical protein